MSVEIESRPAPGGALPVCPDCKKELEFVWEKRIAASSSVLFVRLGPRVLMCPHCQVWLGQLA